MSKSDYLEKKVLDHWYGGTNTAPPATLYLALFTSDPGEAGGGTEATGAGYARKSVTNNTTNFPNATGDSPSTKSNGTQIAMAPATGDWSSGANMTHFVWFDAAAAGNRLHKGALAVAKPVLNGDTPTFEPGDLVITED